MSPAGKIRSLLATARIANVPSVVGNVWLGIATSVTAAGTHHSFSVFASAAAAAAGVLVYLAGNFLNDWMDLSWDRTHRPERALPRGLFSHTSYLLIAITLALAGVVTAAWAAPAAAAWAVALLAAIVIYTYWHKRTPWAVIAMGSCRALLPLMGSAAVDGNPGPATLACSAGLLCYIAGLSLSARYEAVPDTPPAIGYLSKILFAATAASLISAAASLRIPTLLILLAGSTPFLLWLALSLSLWRKPVPRHVSCLLAGIPWVDAIILLPLALHLLQTSSSTLSITSLLLPPTTFAVALILQRVAPAT